MAVVSDQSRDSDYAHLMPLFAELAALPADHPDRVALRSKLVTGYLPVVQHIARRFGGRGEPVDDLEQAGTVGLLNAVDRFEPDRGIDFLSYAVPTITGEVRRHFRDRTWSMRVPRRLKDLQSSINSTVSQLSQGSTGPPGRARSPRAWDSAEEVVEGLDAQQAYRSTSLDELVSGADTSLADTLGSADAELDKVEYRQTLAPLLDELPGARADDPRAALLRQHDPDPDRRPGGDLADARVAAARADGRGPAAQDAQ